MLVKIKVKPNAKKNKVEEKDGFLVVSVKEKAEKGKANKALIKVLADYFSIPTSSIRIVKGGKTREKIVEIKR